MKRNIQHLFVILLLSVFVQNATAQKEKLTLQDAVFGQYQKLRPADIRMMGWIPGTNKYSFTEEEKLKEAVASSGRSNDLLTTDQLNRILNLGNKKNQLSYIPTITWINGETFHFKHHNAWYKVNPYENELISAIKLNEESGNEDYCKTNDHIAYTIKNNLYIASYSGKKEQITHDKNMDIVNGQEVHRREFGIHKGTFWSPTGKKLAFYRKDESMVTDFPLVDITQRVAGHKPIKYPMAGMQSHHVKVGVYDLNSGKTIFLKTGKPLDQFLTNIEWGPNGKYIYIAVLNREQNHMKLNQYNAVKGSFVKTLFEEKHEKYVEPLQAVRFLPNNNKRFIWQSRRDGYNHLYLYNTDGELIKQLTRGKWEVVGDFLHFDSGGKHLFFVSTRESPIERHVYKANVTSGKISRLTSAPGFHRPTMGGKHQFIIDEYSSTEIPGMIQILNTEGKQVRELLAAENPLEDYRLGEMEISTLKAADGKTDLYYRLIKPADFDSEKQYPAIVYVYGGPHAQLVHNRWLGGASLWQYYMAQKGYVMLTLDNRGSAARGLEFENIIFRQLGKTELADQMQGIKMLKELEYVDNSRIGVHGWSYGGFMTTTMMLKKPGAFQVGVAGGPVIDWKYYEVMYGERYMDMPGENPEGYKKANLKNYVKNLDGDLLIIQGYMDDIVVKQHSLSFLRACIENGVQVDYFMYPRHEHNVGGRDRLHLMEKITRYFEDNL